MTNTGLIDLAVRTLIVNRIGRMSRKDVEDNYAWSITVMLTEHMQFQVFISERVFKQFYENDVTMEEQVNALTKYIFELVEEDITKDIHISNDLMN